MNNPVSKWLREIHPALFVLIVLGGTYVVVLPQALLSLIVPQLELGPGASALKSSGLTTKIVIASILGPLLETWVFQWVPVWLLRGKLHLPWGVILVLAAALFASAHTYSLGYVAYSFFIGLVLVYGYAVRYEPGQRPFLLIFLVHALRNTIATVLLA